MKTSDKFIFLVAPPFLTLITFVLGIVSFKYMDIWGMLFNFSALPFLIEKAIKSHYKYLLFKARFENIEETNEVLNQLRQDRSNLELLQRLQELLAEGNQLDEQSRTKRKRQTGH